jgi:PKD repeat protein
MVANFAANVTCGPAPLTVNFTNLSTGEIDKCLWLFGDGGHSASCDNPTHTYTEDGRYTVSLAVIGPASDDFTSRPGYIEVGDFDTTRLPLILAQ